MTILQFLILILLLLDILLFYGIFLSPQGILGLHEQSRQVEELQNKISKLREDNHRLFRRIQGFKSNPQAQERLVREQLGWVRENELMIEFVEPANNRP
jgi:cell division protein FtsB